jgi:hypothetical protein
VAEVLEQLPSKHKANLVQTPVPLKKERGERRREGRGREGGKQEGQKIERFTS